MKYYNLPNGRTKAVISNTRYDALNYVRKLLKRLNPNVAYYADYLLMDDSYTGTVTLQYPDTHNEYTGREYAKQKALDNYHRAFDKRVNRFMVEMSALFNEFVAEEDDVADVHECSGGCQNCTCK